MSLLTNPDEYYMKMALNEAQNAFDEDEVPIGAIIVAKGKIIGKGYNQVEKLNDVTAHAEMLAITAGANYMGTKFLEEATLYVTIEPCLMCATAIKWARIGRLVIGAKEPKVGFSLYGENILHPKTEYVLWRFRKGMWPFAHHFFPTKTIRKVVVLQ
jgi:tRNA(adenine34) deaminase